jgi:GGDEF domain-containing protein
MAEGAAREPVALAEALLAVHRVSDPEQACRAVLQALAPAYGDAFTLRVAADRPGAAGRAVSFAGADGPVFARLRAAGWPTPRRFEMASLLGMAGGGDSARIHDVAAIAGGTALGEWMRCVGPELGSVSVAVAPLAVTAPASGVLALFTGPGWPDRVAEVVAAHIAAAMTNLLRAQNLQRSAEIDPETLVHTSRRFESEAVRELQRAVRHWHQVSVIVVRPDDESGPGRLGEISAELVRTIRRSDTAGRLDSGGFGLVLPETGAGGAARVLARLGERAGRGHIRLRAGAATFPEDGRAWEELLEIAQSRLRPVESVAPDTDGAIQFDDHAMAGS